MNDRIDELKGNVKKGVGKLTNDREMEAEGRAEQDTAKAKRKAKGVGNQIKGQVEQTVGRATGDEETEAQGIADRLKGKTQQR